MKKALFLFVFIFCVIFMRARELDSLLQELDASIKERAVGFRQKENSLSLLMKKLSKSSSEKQKYGLLKKIMYEYSYYRIDSAIFYADKCIASATLLKYSDEIIELQMQKAYFLGFLNQFHKSFQLMEAINFEDLSLPLQKKYIYIMILIYHNKVRELENDQIKKEYNLEIKKKIDLYFKIEKKRTYEYLSLKAYKYYLEKKSKMAERIIMKILAKKNLSVYQREETLFNLGVVYMEEGSDRMIDAAEKRLIQAAILCNRNAITKNSPFILLALLSANKDYKLAYRYITLATSDTSLFSIDHKVVTREKVYNLIQAIYNHEIKSQKTILQVVLSIVFLLSIIILFILIILYRMNLMLKKKSKELISLNNKLKNTNKMKEVYVGYFLNQYSIYIDKIIDYKKYVIRLINAGHPANTIKKEAMSFINTKEDLNDFFIDFDKSILELFPHFVQEVNELLQPEQRYKIQSNPNDSIERLNTELRILALLRLGIYDNKKIALFFRLTLQTVYNYRSKAKSRAINERSFEEKIKCICEY